MHRVTGPTSGLCFALLAAAAWQAPAAAQDQQLGARAKAMGGSYTAFQDDPVLVWLNPAGIATQPEQLSIVYQTYTAYPLHEDQGAAPTDPPVFSTKGQRVLADPEFLPSYLGMVFPVGKPESAMAFGICYARPYLLSFSLHELQGPGETVFSPSFGVEQSLSRVRAAFAKDFSMRERADEGWLTHIAFGMGVDLGMERWRFTSPGGDRTGTAVSLGYGGGLLIGLIDDPELLTLNLGVAYQSPVHFDFVIDPVRFPAFDMPQQVNAGATVYLHAGIPLRLTADAQFLAWKTTAESPAFDGYRSFRNAVNYSVGAEYKLALSEEIVLFPRAGYRRFQAPWEDRNDLPATGRFKLVLNTKGSQFNIATFGLGISWITESKKVRGIDLAGDAGGDSYNVALGYTHEF
jgi:long-subunit fatty acid transport protein